MSKQALREVCGSVDASFAFVKMHQLLNMLISCVGKQALRE
jgi:hypothetical protein